VRGLESLGQPSRVTLVTKSRYVSRGFSCGLDSWRENGWQWERFGKMVPVKDLDLWQRVDQALKFHQVECRKLRFDAAHSSAAIRRPSTRRAARRATAVVAQPAAADARARQARGPGWNWLAERFRAYRARMATV
jgi:ribonuclease HI